jgi:chaperonin GroES
MNVKPLFNRVIILPQENDILNKSGLIIPPEMEDTPRVGKVVAVGDDTKHCKKDDIILWRQHGGDEIFVDNELYLIMNEQDVIAIVGEQKKQEA